MTGLETAFYIIAIVFMSLMLILFIALVVAVFVIRAKVNKIHKLIEDKIDNLTNIVERSGEVAGTIISAGKKILSKKK